MAWEFYILEEERDILICQTPTIQMWTVNTNDVSRGRQNGDKVLEGTIKTLRFVITKINGFFFEYGYKIKWKITSILNKTYKDLDKRNGKKLMKNW